MILKRFSLIISLTFLFFSSLACGWGPSYDQARVVLFLPDLDISADFYNFYYSDINFNNNYFNSSKPDYPEDNINEWNKYIDGLAKPDDIGKFVYEYSIQEVIDYKNKSRYWWEKRNSFADKLLYIGKLDVFDYIIFAKKVEIILKDSDPWYGDNYDYSAMRRLIRFGKLMSQNSDDVFLKQRYAYQVIVLLFYMNEHKEVVDFYDSFFKNIPESEESILKYWSLSYVASCFSFLGDENRSQKLFLRVLENSPAKSLSTYYNLNKNYFKENFDKLSDHEKYYYLVLTSMHNAGKKISVLKTLASQNVNSDHFKLLAIRELNKLEDWLLTKNYTGVPSNNIANYANDFGYAKKLINFSQGVLLKAEPEDKAFWNIYLAHLNFLVKNYGMAKSYLSKAKYNINTNEEALQYHITSALVNISTNNETGFYNEISWLLADSTLNIKKDKIWTNIFVSAYNVYHKQKKYDKAATFLAYILTINYDNYYYYSNTWTNFKDPFFYLDRFANEQQVENFITFNQNVNQANLNKFLLKDYQFDKNRYLDLLGTFRLRSDDLYGALNFYKQVDSNFWYNSYSYKYYLSRNPFASAYLPSFFDETKYDKRFVNKAFFVEQLIDKKNKFKSSYGVEKSILAYELGNAYANMTYFGKAWYYVCYGKSVSGGRLQSTSFNYLVNGNYKTGKKAFEYYNIALNYSKTKHDKSKIYIASLALFEDVNLYEEGDLTDDFYYLDYASVKDSLMRTNYYKLNFEKELPTLYNKFVMSCKY